MNYIKKYFIRVITTTIIVLFCYKNYPLFIWLIVYVHWCAIKLLYKLYSADSDSGISIRPTAVPDTNAIGPLTAFLLHIEHRAYIIVYRLLSFFYKKNTNVANISLVQKLIFLLTLIILLTAASIFALPVSVLRIIFKLLHPLYLSLPLNTLLLLDLLESKTYNIIYIKNIVYLNGQPPYFFNHQARNLYYRCFKFNKILRSDNPTINNWVLRYCAEYERYWSLVNAKIGESRRLHICLKYRGGADAAETTYTQFTHNINKPELLLRYPHAFIRMFELNTGVEKSDSGALYIPKKTPILLEKDLTQAQLQKYAITNLPISALIFETMAKDEYIKTAPNDLIKNEIINKFPSHINKGINTILSHIDDIDNNNTSWDNIDSSIDQSLMQ